jgi:hypothetical protein
MRLALSLTAALLLPTAAGAATYAAKPIAPVAAKRIVARDISWTCGPATCVGASGDSRPAVLCQGLAKQAGQLASFTVDGRAFAAAELARCNAAVRAPAPALASN